MGFTASFVASSRTDGTISPVRKAPLATGTAVATDFILGMGKVGEAVKILLDIDMVLDGGTVAKIVKETATSGLAPSN